MIIRLLLIAVAAMTLTLGGCRKEPPPPTEPTITEENLDAELEKMETEIEADIAAEQ
jgi:hypothetical protein